MLLTHSSSFAMSVSSSQGFTSSKMEDLATSAGSNKKVQETLFKCWIIFFYPSPRNLTKCFKRIISSATPNSHILCLSHTCPLSVLLRKRFQSCNSFSPTEECHSCCRENSCGPGAVGTVGATPTGGFKHRPAPPTWRTSLRGSIMGQQTLA